jgi:GNAT superfamily N-acetyltransferase
MTATTDVERAVLRDGTVLVVRPMRPDDEDRLVAFHARLSPESQRLRFFNAHPRLTSDEVWRFTHVDGHERAALVAEHDGEILGVARYDRLPRGAVAEAAFVVRDDHQGLGIGTLLLDRLADHARQEGLTDLVAETLPENTRMLHVLRGFTAGATSRYDDGVVCVTVPLDSPQVHDPPLADGDG